MEHDRSSDEKLDHEAERAYDDIDLFFDFQDGGRGEDEEQEQEQRESNHIGNGRNDGDGTNDDILRCPLVPIMAAAWTTEDPPTMVGVEASGEAVASAKSLLGQTSIGADFLQADSGEVEKPLRKMVLADMALVMCLLASSLCT